MGVAKMKYLNVYGPQKMMLYTLGAIARSQCFAPETSDVLQYTTNQPNKYEPMLTKAKGLLKDLDQSSLAPDFFGPEKTYHFEQVEEFMETFAAEVARRNKRRTEIESELEISIKTEELLSHMRDININIEELFTVDYLKIRMGRLPKTSYTRLEYYAEKGFNFTNFFNFIVYDFDNEYYWGLYFASKDNAKEIDQIFSTLYFERIRIPEFVQGKPEEAVEAIRNRQKELRDELATIVTPTGIVNEEELTTIQHMTSWLFYMNQLHNMMKYAMVFNNTFYINGFVPVEDYPKFEAMIAEIDSVHIKKSTDAKKVPAKPPVKLKNRWFARPFEMFTEMYGLPTYNDIDPTMMVAIIYSVLYGIMFADLGQGLVLGLFGYFYMYKKKHMPIGPILARVSIFSCLFGLLFSSVFGYEHLLDPLWHAVGLSEKPFEVMANASINLILMASVAIGVLIISVAILTNIISKLRKRQFGAAVTDPNGIAGLVFYLSVVMLALDKLLFHIGFSSSIFYVLLLILLPIVVMYMKEPLTSLIDGKKPHIESVSDLLVSGFFEMFVTLLEFMANTVSFLRVGGFVLAHAGMMSVVVTLAGMAGNMSLLVMILGNIFVMCLEGLIVGIQALRLNYYEVFSRFYEADGIGFRPLKLESDSVEL